MASQNERTTRARRLISGLALVAVGAFALLAFSGCPEALYHPSIEPDDFVSEIDNTYFPLVPGTTFTYSSVTPEGTEIVEVVVTEDTKIILGVTCRVVRDTVTLDDELVEDTFDWYAQDEAGNVWYFGEDSKEYEDGEVVSTEGSWEAGVDGAYPGIIMKGHPRLLQTYRQEFLPGEAEDMATVVGLHESVTVPYGTFKDCLRIREFTPLEPGVIAYKYYASGVGEVLTEEDDLRSELTEVDTP